MTSVPFENVYQLRQNYHFKYTPLPNVNGIFGAGYFPQEEYNVFWKGLIGNGAPTKIAVSYIASDFDMEYIPGIKASDYSDT